MSSTSLSATRKSAGLARLQVENSRPCSVGLDLAIFLISRRSGRGERPRPPTPAFRVERLEAVGFEVVDHVADPVRAGERHLSGLRRQHALSGQQHHLGPPPGHHRPSAPADDPQQSLALAIVDLPHPHTLSHVIILAVRCRPAGNRTPGHNRANVA